MRGEKNSQLCCLWFIWKVKWKVFIQASNISTLALGINAEIVKLFAESMRTILMKCIPIFKYWSIQKKKTTSVQDLSIYIQSEVKQYCIMYAKLFTEFSIVWHKAKCFHWDWLFCSNYCQMTLVFPLYGFVTCHSIFWSRSKIYKCRKRCKL